MQFQYVAYTLAEGVVKGRLDAETEAEARSELSGRGYKTLQIKRPPRINVGKFFESQPKVKPGELLAFARSSSTMLASGATLLRILEMLESEASKGMKKVLGRIRERVSQGDSLTLSMREFPNVFDAVFLSVIEVGEYTGKLAPALLQLADIMEAQQKAKAEAMKAMMMPLFLIGSSGMMLGFMVFVAFPPLINTFNSMDVEIPLVTRIMIGLVEGLVNGIVYVGGTVVTLVVVYKVLQRFPATRFMLHSAKAKAPIIGGIVMSSELGRFARIMATLLANGVDIPSALRLAKSSVKNEAMMRAWDAAEDSLINGHRMSKALLEHKILPQMFVELMAIGEDTNTLPRTMSEIADAYQKEFEDKIGKMLAIMEPVSTFAVGGLVLFMALSVMKPILSAAGEVAK